MLSVETELHLRMKVAARGASLNDLAGWAFTARNGVICELVARLVWRIQEEHLTGVLAGEEELVCYGCGVIHSGPGSVLRRGSRARQVKTSSGTLRFRLRQVTCRDCGKTWSPYPELLGLAPRQRVIEELERRLVDWVTELSYRKTSRLAGQWLGERLSARQLHRLVQRRGAEVSFTRAGPVETVVADGTKVLAGHRQRGENIVLALQIEARRTRHGRAAVRKRLLGFGIGPGSWLKALAPVRDATLVVTDGEAGVAQAVAQQCPGARHQRCEWHLPYSVRQMLGREGLKLAEQRRVAAELAEILRNPSPAARSRYEALSESLRSYRRSHRLLRRAAAHVFYDPPSAERTTGVVERQMREVDRRVDNGARWSVPGVAHLLRLRLAQRCNPDDYERLWKPLQTVHWKLVSHAGCQQKAMLPQVYM
jgi:hypothetical protein